MSLLDIRGKKLYVKRIEADEGSEKAITVFFIHGLGSAIEYYEGLITHLKTKKVDLIFMDTEGAARSPLSGTKPTIDTIADDVIGVLDHFGIEKSVIVGHSMGGMIAARTAERYPRRIIQIILIGPVHPTEKIAIAFKRRIQRINETGGIGFLIEMVPSSAVGRNANDDHKRKIASLIVQSSPEGYIANCHVIADAAKAVPNYSLVKQPALLIAGEDDKTAPYEGCVQVIEKSLGGQVTTEELVGVGHWHCVEAPEAVAVLIAKVI